MVGIGNFLYNSIIVFSFLQFIFIQFTTIVFHQPVSCSATIATFQPSVEHKPLSTISAPCLCQEFRCDNGTFCLDKSKVCSGFPDCPHGEDELKERCVGARRSLKVTCGEGEFRCKFGGCIGLTQVCDLKVDCWGGVDEASDFCDWVNST